MSTAAHLHPWKPLPHGPTPICDALMADWLTTHRQHYPGEPPVGRQPRITPVPTPLLDRAVKDAQDTFQAQGKKEKPRPSRHTRPGASPRPSG